jgi:hypothetical protein
MGKFEDLTGQVFGRLTVMQRGDTAKNGDIRWWCQCSCGNPDLILVRTYNLKSEHTQSCGCIRNEKSKQLGRNKKYNQYDLSGEYGIGYTNNGEEFYFDLEDYDKIKDYCWYIDGHGYVASGGGVLMHRIIFPTEKGYIPDHIHGKSTNNDNRKSNLRVATDSQNHMNMRLSARNTSGVTGVSEHKCGGWVAHIKAGKITKSKFFKNKSDAIKQRKEWEALYFKEYSYENSQKLSI